MLDNWERNYHIHEMPLDLLMDEQKLREFCDMFLAHTLTLEDEKNKMLKALAKHEAQIEFVKDKHKTLKEYLRFLEFGGHDFVKEMVKDNHHVFTQAQEKIFGYKLCAKELKIKKDGWHICIKIEGHKGRCSHVTPSQIRSRK